MKYLSYFNISETSIAIGFFRHTPNRIIMTKSASGKDPKIIILEKQTNEIDQETGKVTTVRQEFTKVIERDKFIQVYLEDISGLLRIDSKVYLKILVKVWEQAQYNENRIILIKPIKEDIAEAVGCSTKTVNNGITELVKLKLLLRQDKSVYYLNPKLFFKGSHDRRVKCIQSMVSYKLIDPN